MKLVPKCGNIIKVKVLGINLENTNSIVNLIEQTWCSIFSIDEKESIHKGSSKHVTDIIASINAHKTATKEDILPLQSDLWKSWAKLKKNHITTNIRVPTLLMSMPIKWIMI